MAYNFPDAPTAGQEFDTGDAVYIFQNGAWDLKSGAITDYVLKAGDTMTGDLNMSAASIKMGDGAGIHWGNTSAQTDPLNFAEGICVYGYGSTSQFGFTITSGTLNYVVQNTGNKHDFIVGAANPFRILSTQIENYVPVNFRAASYAYGRFTQKGNNHVTIEADNYGVAFYGGGFLYKKAGEGLILRESSGNYRSAIQNNAGTWKGWISYQTTAALSVEELVEERVAPLLQRIADLEARLAKAKL